MTMSERQQREENLRALVERFRHRRMSLAQSLRSAAKEVGVGFSTLSRIERGVGLPDRETEARLLAWLANEPLGQPRLRQVREHWGSKIEKRMAAVEDELRTLRRRVDGE